MSQNQNDKTLGVLPLAMFAVGTTLASGVFSLSGDFAAGGAYTLGNLNRLGNLRYRYVWPDNVFL